MPETEGVVKLDYPWSIVAYFVVGAVGAIAFLVLLLLFDKDVAILRNRVLGLRVTATLYILLGGAISAVLNLAASPEFGPGQFALAFGSGLGWPALATGVGAGKKVGEISDQAADLSQKAQTAVEGLMQQLSEVAEAAQRIGQQALQNAPE